MQGLCRGRPPTMLLNGEGLCQTQAANTELVTRREPLCVGCTQQEHGEWQIPELVMGPWALL